MKEFLFLGEGRHRKVYLCPSKKYVIKIPLNDYGILDNFNEAYLSKIDEWLPKKYKAKCRLVEPLLVMEYVKPVVNFKNLPDWTYGVDCQQVGFTLKGNLVAYDYA